MMKPENEALRKYYEFAIQMNQTFQKLLGSSVQIASNFIPNIRQEVIDEILGEFASKDVVILGGTLVYTEGFDGFRIL